MENCAKYFSDLILLIAQCVGFFVICRYVLTWIMHLLSKFDTCDKAVMLSEINQLIEMKALFTEKPIMNDSTEKKIYSMEELLNYLQPEDFIHDDQNSEITDVLEDNRFDSIRN